MTKGRFKRAMTNHCMWLANPDEGKQAVIRLDSAEYLVTKGLYSRADFSYSWFKDADLHATNFAHAVLRNVNFAGCDLSLVHFQNADLSNANLAGAHLRRTEFSGAKVGGMRTAWEIKPMKRIRHNILASIKASQGCILDMKHWHACETVHCLAGWITTIHPQGKLLESGLSTATAAALILHAAGIETIPDFYDTDRGGNERAMNWLQTESQTNPIPEKTKGAKK